jgi:hypothetical protein
LLVFDKDYKIVGKLNMLDVLVALEPKYGEMGEIRKFSTHGFSKNFILALEEQYRLLNKPLDDVCRKATEYGVKNCMTKPPVGEYIKEEASLSQAINQLVVGRHQSLWAYLHVGRHSPDGMLPFLATTVLYTKKTYRYCRVAICSNGSFPLLEGYARYGLNVKPASCL